MMRVADNVGPRPARVLILRLPPSAPQITVAVFGNSDGASDHGGVRYCASPNVRRAIDGGVW